MKLREGVVQGERFRWGLGSKLKAKVNESCTIKKTSVSHFLWLYLEIAKATERFVTYVVFGHSKVEESLKVNVL